MCLLLAGGRLVVLAVGRPRGGGKKFRAEAKDRVAEKNHHANSVTVKSASTAPKFLTTAKPSTNTGGERPTSFAYRLSNTTKSLDELVHDDKAILLENALIDLRNPLNFSIPKNLQSQGDPGAYIVQANGPIDNAFRAMLAAAGAQIVSYIPNDAYLVRVLGRHGEWNRQPMDFQ